MPEGLVRLCQNYKTRRHLQVNIREKYYYNKEDKRVVDQMKEFLKAKMVGGKINFEPWHMLSADFDNFDAENDFELAIRLLEKQQERE